MTALIDIYPYLLPLFFVIAFVHSSVGLAGGSSYTAFMAIYGVPLQVIPSISLSLNTLVSSIGTRNFVKHNHFDVSLWLPFQLASLPFVYLGARTELPALLFYGILLVTLLLSLVRLVSSNQPALNFQFSKLQSVLVSLLVGAVLGFLSGSIGIGGGIYLIPCILLLGLGTIKQASAVAVVFILCNSIIGLATKWQMGLLTWQMLYPALIAVGAGGALGSWLGASYFKAETMRWGLVLVLGVAVGLLGWRIFAQGLLSY